MNLKKVKRISDVIYIITILYAVAIVAKNYYDQSVLPEGVCPINNNYEYIVLAIALLVITFVVTSIIDYKFKKQKDTNVINTGEGEE